MVEGLVEDYVHIASISLHAMVGKPNPRAMRVVGRLKKKWVVILVDNGSTYNFVDTIMTSKCGLRVLQSQSIPIKVANGDVLTSQGKCTSVAMQIQGTSFTTYFFTLSLGGCDVVLGVQWLLSLCPVLWDFIELKMEVIYKEKSSCLRCLPFNGATLIDDKEVCKISPMENKGLLLQLISTKSNESSLVDCKEVSELLLQFDRVFEEPKGLPPRRSHDYQLQSKEGIVPVSVRPYRYPYYQKTELENIVE